MRHRFHWLARWRMHRLFAGAAGGAERRRLMPALSRCGECASLYRRYGLVEAALGQTPLGLAPLTIERLGASVLAAARPAEPEDAGHWRPVLGAAALGLALAALFVVLSWPSSSDHVAVSPRAPLAPVAPVAFASRGGSSGLLADVGVRAFVVSLDGTAVAERATLSSDDVLTFTFSNLAPSIHALALFGVQSDGVVRWYYPGYDGKRSVAIPGGKVDEPLGDGIRLSVNHSRGWLRISAVFSEAPLAAAELERLVQSLRAEPGALESLEPLAVPRGAVEHSFLLEVGD